MGEALISTCAKWWAAPLRARDGSRHPHRGIRGRHSPERQVVASTAHGGIRRAAPRRAAVGSGRYRGGRHCARRQAASGTAHGGQAWTTAGRRVALSRLLGNRAPSAGRWQRGQSGRAVPYAGDPRFGRAPSAAPTARRSFVDRCGAVRGMPLRSPSGPAKRERMIVVRQRRSGCEVLPTGADSGTTASVAVVRQALSPPQRGDHHHSTTGGSIHPYPRRSIKTRTQVPGIAAAGWAR